MKSRRDFLTDVAVTAAGLAFAPVIVAEAFQSPAAVTRPTVLFNGKDRTGFYTFLRGLGKNTDPKNVFTVHDGMLHVSGEVNGGIITERSFQNYRLVAEYKWGEKAWPPRDKGAMDCGILLHCGGEDGAALGTWPQSIQFQIYQGAVGDLVLLPGKDTLSVTVEGEERSDKLFHHVPGAPAQVRSAGGTKRNELIPHYGRDPEWKNVKGFLGKNDAEKPHGEWNTVEAICDRDTLTYIVNGRQVHKATNSSLTSGAIGVQSESGEIFFRRLELLPLT